MLYKYWLQFGLHFFVEPGGDMEHIFLVFASAMISREYPMMPTALGRFFSGSNRVLWVTLRVLSHYFSALLFFETQVLSASSINKAKNSPNPQPCARACCGTMLAGEIPGIVLASRKKKVSPTRI